VEKSVQDWFTSVLLAGVGGFLDCFSYVGHGHVFATALTGNVVLLGVFALAQGKQQSLKHLPPIVAFFLGVGAAKAILLPGPARRLKQPYRFALALEIALLVCVSLLPQTVSNFWITTTVAFAGAIQVEAFRMVDGRNYNSTFTTGNLRSLSEGTFEWLFGNKKAEARTKIRDFGLICLLFFLGALAGAWATTRLGNRALWIDVALLLIVILRVKERPNSSLGGYGAP
jgi:uncharacterized membrane protein YoaK (UPF0700 family)